MHIFIYTKSKRNCETFSYKKSMTLCKKQDNFRYVLYTKKQDTLRYAIFMKSLSLAFICNTHDTLVTLSFYILKKARHLKKSKTICVSFLYTKSQTLCVTQFFSESLKIGGGGGGGGVIYKKIYSALNFYMQKTMQLCYVVIYKKPDTLRYIFICKKMCTLRHVFYV